MQCPCDKSAVRGFLATAALAVAVIAASAASVFLAQPIAARPAVPPSSDMRLFDFTEAADSSATWRVINDGVMGGVSSSAFETDSGRATFSGTVSGANNGGFASVRTVIPAGADLADVNALAIRVRGDGQRYKLTARTDGRFDGVSYRHSFRAPKNDWQRIVLPIADFKPSWRGRPVPGAPPLRAADIRQLGFIIADKQFGPFRLEIESISAVRAAP